MRHAVVRCTSKQQHIAAYDSILSAPILQPRRPFCTCKAVEQCTSIHQSIKVSSTHDSSCRRPSRHKPKRTNANSMATPALAATAPARVVSDGLRPAVALSQAGTQAAAPPTLDLRAVDKAATTRPKLGVAKPPLFGAGITNGTLPVRAPLSPDSRRRADAARRRRKLERQLMEEDRRKFLKWYNPEKVGQCIIDELCRGTLIVSNMHSMMKQWRGSISGEI